MKALNEQHRAATAAAVSLIHKNEINAKRWMQSIATIFLFHSLPYVVHTLKKVQYKKTNLISETTVLVAAILTIQSRLSRTRDSDFFG